MWVIIAVIFYVVLILPMRNKQRKLEQLIKNLKAGDKVILNAGIFATIVSVDEGTFQIRIDEKTRVKVLKSAIAGLQGTPDATEKK